MTAKASSTPERRLALKVSKEQFERIEDAWYLATLGKGTRRISGYEMRWFDWAVEHVTGASVRGYASYSLEIAR